MPNTRPDLIFSEEGTCQACLNYELRQNIDWEDRFRELKALAKNYKECVIGVSGGKDSYYLVYLFKEVLKMNPSLVKINDGFSTTEAGRHNLRNLASRFGCSLIECTLRHSYLKSVLGYEYLKEITRRGFEEKAFFPHIDYDIYTIPSTLAESVGLAVFGENPAYEYGLSMYDNPLVDYEAFRGTEAWIGQHLKAALHFMPKVRAIYTSFYVPWSGHEHYELALKYGFKDLSKEWAREGHIESYDSIDSVGWLVSP